MDWPILSTLTFLPLVGAAFILVVRGDAAVVARNARNIALWTSVIAFVLSVPLWIYFEPADAGFQFEERVDWLAEGITYHMGIDGMSLPFILLTTFLTPICILASWESIQTRVKEYMIAFLVMETMMIGVFAALDFVLFYLFFEGGLIPMFLIIGIWGSDNRVYATFKFFLYTLLGSVLMLLGLLWLYFQFGTTDIPELMRAGIDPFWQRLLWLGFFAAFAVKIPMWPVHTWLPDAHVQAPTAGSVVLAAVLLKIGGYGFLRISIPILPDATVTFTPLVYALSIVAIVYTSLVALMQEDMKKLIAYSSIAHMGFVTIGLFTFTPAGVEGAIMVMLSHGLVSAALFLCVGVVYDRIHTRLIARYGGVVNRMPLYAAAFMVFTLANVGLPGTSGFLGEFLVLVGAFQANTWVAFLACTSVILSAAYALWLYRRVIFGVITREDLKAILDLNKREVAILAPLVALIILFGVYPMPILELFHAPVENLIAQHELALEGLRGATNFAAVQ
ncbi:MAG: NADH-quinone oxidoreductase subunit M [Alphaproteobacteria bacterium]|nr:NADH-quinone oxidoreductase subunit M [Alphaproteobacteria bacterium]